jgi:hypothetical protein
MSHDIHNSARHERIIFALYSLSSVGISIFDSTRHDPRINGSGMGWIFLPELGLVRFRSTRSDSINYIFEVIF